MNEMNEREQDAAETSYQKISRAIEENLLPELVRTSETLDNFAKKARLSDMRGIILSDAWVTGMAATMRHAQRRINEQAATIERLTAERDAARKEMAELVARLTKIADENETVCREHTSVGNDQDDAWVSAWGAAGKELREALGIESEASE